MAAMTELLLLEPLQNADRANGSFRQDYLTRSRSPEVAGISPSTQRSATVTYNTVPLTGMCSPGYH